MELKLKTKIISDYVKARIVEQETWHGIIIISGQIASYFKPHLWQLFTASSLSIVAFIKIITKGSKTIVSEALNAAADAISDNKSAEQNVNPS